MFIIIIILAAAIIVLLLLQMPRQCHKPPRNDRPYTILVQSDTAASAQSPPPSAAAVPSAAGVTHDPWSKNGAYMKLFCCRRRKDFTQMRLRPRRRRFHRKAGFATLVRLSAAFLPPFSSSSYAENNPTPHAPRGTMMMPQYAPQVYHPNMQPRLHRQYYYRAAPSNRTTGSESTRRIQVVVVIV